MELPEVVSGSFIFFSTQLFKQAAMVVSTNEISYLMRREKKWAF